LAKLRVALVGCGKIADGHVEEIQKLQTAELVAVCDREPLMAEHLAARYALPAWYGDVTEMLARERVDVLHITTPPQSHLSLVRLAAATKCHVMVEKPMAMDANEAQQLIETVEAAGVKLCVNYWPNFDPQALALRKLIAAGELGDPVHLESHYGYNLSGDFGQALLADAEHWVNKLPGKLFHNVMDHLVNKVEPFLPAGEVDVKVMAYRRRSAVNSASDALLDELRVVLAAKGVSAYLTFSSHIRPTVHFLRVYGTKNIVHVDYNLRTLVKEPVQTFPSVAGRLLPPARQGWAYIRQAVGNTRLFANAEFHYFAGMNRLFVEFYESIAKDTIPPIAYSHLLRCAQIMDAVFAQAYPPRAIGAHV